MALTVKNPPAKAGDAGSIPGSGRSPGEENGKPLHYSRLVNSTVTGDWQATIHRVAYYPQGCKESDTTKQLYLTPQRNFYSYISNTASVSRKFLLKITINKSSM